MMAELVLALGGSFSGSLSLSHIMPCPSMSCQIARSPAEVRNWIRSFLPPVLTGALAVLLSALAA